MQTTIPHPIVAAARDVLTAMNVHGVRCNDASLFEHLALSVFEAQRRDVPIYATWCAHALGSSAAVPDSWRAIPALPIAAFKRTRVAAHIDNDVAVWQSSGTTGTATSRHFLPSLDLYDTSLRTGFAAALLPDASDAVVVQLAPSASDAPHSSLSHMLDAIRASALDGGCWVNASFEVDIDGAWDALARATAAGSPVVLVATSFALVALLDGASNRSALSLPPGSRVMDTGGYKGRSRELDRVDLLASVEARLGVAYHMVENEYGMSELSSQSWIGSIAAEVGRPLSNGSTGARWQPWWMRTRVVDPVTLADVADGETGLLVHHDLANAYTCAAIRTEDVGRRIGDSYELLGRAPGAQIRGCSLSLEDVL